MKTNFLSKSNSFNDFNQVVYFCMVEIVIVIYTMLNIYTVKQKSLGYNFFVVYNNAKPSLGIFFIIFLDNILFIRQLITLCIFI